MITINTTIITTITWTGGHGRDFEAGARKTDRDREPRAAQEHWVGQKMRMMMMKMVMMMMMMMMVKMKMVMMVKMVIMMMMSPRALGGAEVVSYPAR